MKKERDEKPVRQMVQADQGLMEVMPEADVVMNETGHGPLPDPTDEPGAFKVIKAPISEPPRMPTVSELADVGTLAINGKAFKNEPGVTLSSNRPTIGRIVHYTVCYGGLSSDVFPAIVTGVDEGKLGISIAVFTRTACQPFQGVLEAPTADIGTPAANGKWSWPKR